MNVRRATAAVAAAGLLATPIALAAGPASAAPKDFRVGGAQVDFDVEMDHGRYEVDVDIELDEEPRVLDVPADLGAALDADPSARRAFASPAARWANRSGR